MRPPYDLDHVFLPKFIAVSLLQPKMDLIGERHLRGSSRYLLWEVAHLKKGYSPAPSSAGQVNSCNLQPGFLAHIQSQTVYYPHEGSSDA
jgi:hypothetical protein